MLVFHFLSNMSLQDPLLYAVHERFWMQPNIICFIFINIGISFIFNKCLSYIIPSYVFLFLLPMVVKYQYNSMDMSDDYYLYNHGKNLLDFLPVYIYIYI